MCLAIPGEVIAIDNETRVATVDLVGNKVTADLSILEDVHVGDYVIIHAGIAIHKYNLDEARETLRLLAQLAEAAGEP